jgi:hypothetical protein
VGWAGVGDPGASVFAAAVPHTGQKAADSGIADPHLKQKLAVILDPPSE